MPYFFPLKRENLWGKFTVAGVTMTKLAELVRSPWVYMVIRVDCESRWSRNIISLAWLLDGFKLWDRAVNEVHLIHEKLLWCFDSPELPGAPYHYLVVRVDNGWEETRYDLLDTLFLQCRYNYWLVNHVFVCKLGKVLAKLTVLIESAAVDLLVACKK